MVGRTLVRSGEEAAATVGRTLSGPAKRRKSAQETRLAPQPVDRRPLRNTGLTGAQQWNRRVVSDL
jgi:hypothetical protein